MMSYYWRKHGIRPKVFIEMDSDELAFIKACYEIELENEEKLVSEGKVFPVIHI